VRKSVLLTLLGAFVVVAVAAGLWVAVGRGSGGAHDTGSASADSGSMAPANVQLLERALDSSKLKTQATALAPLAREAFLQRNEPMLPTGVSVALAPATFKASGNAAVINATTSNGHTFTLRLARSGGQWLILYTMEQ
jgi:hypothetical protein